MQIPGTKIFSLSGGLHFANKEYFKNEVYRLVNVKPKLRLKEMENEKQKGEKTEMNGHVNQAMEKEKEVSRLEKLHQNVSTLSNGII